MFVLHIDGATLRTSDKTSFLDFSVELGLLLSILSGPNDAVDDLSNDDETTNGVDGDSGSGTRDVRGAEGDVVGGRGGGVALSGDGGSLVGGSKDELSGEEEEGNEEAVDDH